MAIRIQVPLVIEMTDEQERQYAELNGLPRNGGSLRKKDLVDDIRSYVLTCIQDSGDLGAGGADVSIKER